MHFLKHLSYWEASHHSSESICLLNYQPPRCIHGSIQYLFEAVDTNRNSLFGVKISIKDGCALKNDDNRMPTLCVFLVILKSKNGLLSRQYERRWISLLGSQHVCVLAWEVKDVITLMHKRLWLRRANQWIDGVWRCLARRGQAALWITFSDNGTPAVSVSQGIPEALQCNQHCSAICHPTVTVRVVDQSLHRLLICNLHPVASSKLP